jgi:hypothetical protein
MPSDHRKARYERPRLELRVGLRPSERPASYLY